MYIAVSGNLGSGKSTVARGLARAFGCPLYPRKSYDTSYIEDLFREPERWTAEAQISFMVHKYTSIREGMERDRLFLLDRTFGEEVQVFAEKFHEDGAISMRSMELIRQLAADLEARLESPALIVYCDCPVEVCEARLPERQRSYQMSYPPDHLRKLDDRLRVWLRQQADVPVVQIQTHVVDYRDPDEASRLAIQIDRRIRSPTPTIQLDFFAAAVSENGEGNDDTSRLSGTSLIRAKRVYLAAPFTDRAKPRDLNLEGEARLFSGPELIESMPRQYKRQLLNLARAIESHGHDVMLPHRDINRWGNRALPASEIASRCLASVETADVFIGLVAQSFGCHTELGYALGLRKPVLILSTSTLPTSFFGAGVATMPAVSTLEARSFPQLVEALRKTDPFELLAGGGV